MVSTQWIDSWKGILITLVVLGHVAGGAVHLVPAGLTRDLCQCVYDVIYAFHMPAFFCVAGYAWRPNTEGWGQFAIRKARRLLVPYFFWGIFSIGVFSFTSCFFMRHVGVFRDSYYDGKGLLGMGTHFVGLLSFGACPENEAYRYNSVLWFLPAMFVAVLLFRVIVRFCGSSRGRYTLCAGALICLSLVGRVSVPHCLPARLYSMPNYLLLMLLGYLCSKMAYRRYLSSLTKWWTAILSSGIFVVARVLLPNTSVSYVSYLWAVVFIGLTVWGSFVSLQFAKAFDSGLLATIGRASLAIMVLHKFLVVGLEVAVTPVRHGLCAGVASALFVMGSICLLSMLVCWCADWTLKHWFPISLGLSIDRT